MEILKWVLLGFCAWFVFIMLFLVWWARLPR